MSDQPDLLAPPPAAPVVINTEHARELLRARYPSGEWAFMEEVAPATGGGTRYADAVAVNLWASRGHAVHGFEIKISRSDWLRELKDPSKAEPVFRYCDHWWIVAPKGVVKDGELPPTWGLLEVRAATLHTQVHAPKLEAAPLTRAFFASIMRRGYESLEGRAAAMVRLSISEARGEIDKRVQEGIARGAREVDGMKRRIQAFEEKTGLSFDEYRGPPYAAIALAQKLAILQGYGSEGGFKELERLANKLQACADSVRQALAESGMAATPNTEDA